MKILRKDLQENEKQKVEYTIEKTDTSVKLGFKLQRFGKDYENEVELNLEKYTGKIWEIDLIETDVPTAISIYPIFENHSFGGALPNKTLGRTDIRIARVAIGDDCVVQLAHSSAEIEGFENIIMDSEKSSVGHLIAHSETAKSVVEKAKLRSELLTQIDIRNSIAYLEAQVDALTRLILDLTNENAMAILQEADKYSTLESKGLEKLLKEIEHKKDVREKQAEYYKATQGA